MVTDNRGSDQVDPLEGYSGLSLFPEAFAVSSDPSKPYDFDHELQSIHNHLKSMVLRSPNKLREQAKIIVNGSSKNVNSKIVKDQASMGNNKVLPVVAEVNLRERRPGLGRKRARFSLKPNSSQPVVSSEPTLDIKNLKDPEEFFKAYERHENAEREIQRLKGGILSDSEKQNTSLTKRPRRPGMLGLNKRSIKYKHLYPLDDSNTNSNALSSQEKFDSSIRSPDHHSSQQESGHHFTSQGTELASSISEEEHEVDEILDQLLSYNSEDLEEDRALSVLQERLQIKPIELEKLNLPDFQDIPRIDLKSSRSGKLPKCSHTLSGIDNLLKGIRTSSITPMKHRQGSESSAHHVASPTPQKSPFSSLPLLNQRILRSSPSDDPFSADDIDWVPVTNPSRIGHVNREFADVGRQSDIESPLVEKDGSIEVSKTHSSNVDVLDAGTSESHLPRADVMIDSNMDYAVMNSKLAVHDADGKAQVNEDYVQDEVEVTLQETEVPAQSSLNTVDLALDNHSKELTEVVEERSKIPLDKKRRAESRSQRAPKRGEIDRRKSLAGAGTMWKSGVRRSTRIKCRPLEYWNGERLLYGRIHKSLPTVIGLKYASPAKGDKKTTLKVKSYVSDEHKELVELAALH